MIFPPPEVTPERKGWEQGVADEAACRNEGMPSDAREVRDCPEALARSSRRNGDAAELVGSLARIYHVGQPLKARIRLALQLVFR